MNPDPHLPGAGMHLRHIHKLQDVGAAMNHEFDCTHPICLSSFAIVVILSGNLCLAARNNLSPSQARVPSLYEV